MITFLCPGCRREFRVKLENAGRKIRCTRCLTAARVPVDDPTEELPCLDVPDKASELKELLEKER